jgi:chitodextrinase
MRTTWILAAFATLFVGASILGQPAAAATVERGPYLQVATPTNIIIRWRTEGIDPALTSIVNYGTTLDNLDSWANATPQQTTVLGVGDVNRTVTEHEVALTGLAPNTRYYYDVGDETDVNAGGDATYSFVTPPVVGTDQATRIWVIGDSGTANSDAAAVRDAYKAKVAAESRPTDLWLMLGDNAYNDGKDYHYEAAVFDMYPEILRQAPVWPTRGNHDKSMTLGNGANAPYFDIFTLPTAGEAGGLLSGTEGYYSFDYANIHFIVLDSFGWSSTPTSTMLTWLELPILEEYGVDLVLGGHSHSYERSYLLTGHYGTSGTLDASSMILDNGNGREGGDGAYFKDFDAPLANDGAVYTVAGSSGKATGSGLLNHPAMFYSIKNLGSVVLDIDGSRLDAVFISQTGAVLDSFTMINGVDDTPPTIQSAEAGDANTVFVTYSERVDTVTAEDLANYVIDQSITVFDAIHDSGLNRTTLTTSQLVDGLTYTVTVNDVVDLAGNVIALDSTAQFVLQVVQSRSFQDGVAPTSAYDGTQDLYLRELQPDTTLNNEAQLLMDGDDGGGELVALVRWDVSEIPFDATVDAVSIELDVFNPSSGSYNLYAVLQDWFEAEATWNSRASGALWGAPGASATADRGALVLGTLNPATNGIASIQLNADGLDVVEGWVQDASQNFGLIIVSNGTVDGADVRSREASPLQRPALHVTYTLPSSGGDLEAPSVPTGLTAMAQSESEVALSWQASTDNVGVTGYDVYRDGAMMLSTVATNYTDTGRDPATTYDYAVTAFDAAGNTSDLGAAVSVTTLGPPAATVSVLDVEVQLKFIGKKNVAATALVTVVDENDARIEGAIVHGRWSGLVDASQTDTTGTTGEANFTSPKISKSSVGEFIFAVTDIIIAGRIYDPDANVEASDCVDTQAAQCSTGPGDLPPPSGVGASASGDTITVSWSQVSGATGYRVYRKTPTDADFLSQNTMTATNYVDAVLAPGTYDYVVTTLDSGAGFQSGFSSVASATVSDGSPMELHVPAFTVMVSAKGKNWSGATTVTVLDAGDAPAAGATVTGLWTHEPTGGGSNDLNQVVATTDSNGQFTTTSSKLRASSGDGFRFTVDVVSRGNDTLDVAGSTLFGVALVQ